MATSSAPSTRAAIYLRPGAVGEPSIAQQREDCRRIASERGWQLVGEYLDILAAYDSTEPRLGYATLVEAYRAGQFDALLCWDFDRLICEPRQLEDWIEAQERGLTVLTANGADLSTDGGRMQARLKVAHAEPARNDALHISTSTSATRAAIYLRISLDATGEGLAVTRQREDCQRICTERGWQIVAEYADSIGAYDKRKRRPGYEAMVEAYQIGLFNAIVCWDLDRLTRQPRQLEDWVDAAEDRGLILVTANGEADLSTDGGRMYARIKAAVARAESERKAARQRRAAVQRAEQGKPPLGVRLTGYTPKGEIVEAEAAAVRQMFERFQAGDSLRAIVAWLAETGAPTRHGKLWSPSSVRSILTNPRYCGRAIYMRKENGKLGRWPAIVSEDLWVTVNTRLADPRRRHQVGTDRRYLGSGLFLCGACGAPVVTHGSAALGSRYRCRAGACFTRSAVPIDNLVLRRLRARLAMPDLTGLLASEGPEAQAAADEIRRLRGRLVQFEYDYDAGLIDGRRYKIATTKVSAQLAAAEAVQQRLAAPSSVGGILSAPDPVAAFDAASLGQQRAVLAFFMTVRLHPAPQGRKGLDPNTVQIQWNHA